MTKTVSKRLLIVALASAVGAGFRAWNRNSRSGRREHVEEKIASETRGADESSDTAGATERYLLYFIVPLWVIAGSLDYFRHRRTKIETTSGTLESAIHALMMTEAGIPLLLGLVFEVNAGVILLMIAAFFTHAATAIWDVAFAVERRKVTPNEQHIHSFLEVLPFCAVSFVICLHWKQFTSLFGLDGEKPRFALRKKTPPLPTSYLAGFLGAVAINAAAYGEEIMRCFRAQQQGLTGVDTPKAAQELYANS
jgi:hypothetical protein